MAPPFFRRKNRTRRRALVTAALAKDPDAEVYRDLKPCAKGHQTFRYIKSGHCVQCVAERYRAKMAEAI